jgi:hypothetical protein
VGVGGTVGDARDNPVPGVLNPQGGVMATRYTRGEADPGLDSVGVWAPETGPAAVSGRRAASLPAGSSTATVTPAKSSPTRGF